MVRTLAWTGESWSSGREDGGLSYLGGPSCMRPASASPFLKAIIPMVAPPDTERDSLATRRPLYRGRLWLASIDGHTPQEGVVGGGQWGRCGVSRAAVLTLDERLGR